MTLDGPRADAADGPREKVPAKSRKVSWTRCSYLRTTERGTGRTTTPNQEHPMNRTLTTTVRTLVVAVPLTATLALAAGPAQAFEPKGPTTLELPSGHGDPEPGPQGPKDVAQPKPGPVEPKPQGPGDLAQPEPGPVDPKPQGPGDIAQPDPGPVVDPDVPQGPGDVADAPGCPTHGGCGDAPEQDGTPKVPGADEPTDAADDGVRPTSSTRTAADTVALAEQVRVPSRIDAGVAPSDESLALEWLLVGGTLAGLVGAGLVARRVGRGRA